MSPHSYLLLLFLLVVGTIVGSFLNVVIYRLPRGLSLARPGSHCPKCNQPIRWYDNVPILGWVLLDGKCRDCSAVISLRYPLVEFATGLMFLSLGWTDWVRPQQHAVEVAAAQAEARAEAQIEGGPGLFAAEAAERSSSDAGTDSATEEYVWPLVFHLLLLCSLLAAMLIDVDDQRLPRRLITWPAAAGILLAMYWPAVQVFPFFRSQGAAADWVSVSAAATSFVGMLAAAVLRLATQRFAGVARAREMGLWNCTLALYAVGAFLGWQAVLLIGLLAILWSLVRELPALKAALIQIRPTAVAFLGTFIWCLTERHLMVGG
jgi:prepilin signal peptidase PulO-like enzyme (type II secretory pathway)